MSENLGGLNQRIYYDVINNDLEKYCDNGDIGELADNISISFFPWNYCQLAITKDNIWDDSIVKDQKADCPPDLYKIEIAIIALAKFMQEKKELSDKLLENIKRVNNILIAEEEKDKTNYKNAEESLCVQLEEKVLYNKINELKAKINFNDFSNSLEYLMGLNEPISQFFAQLRINDPAPEIRINRLRLLGDVLILTNQLADFTKLGK